MNLVFTWQFLLLLLCKIIVSKDICPTRVNDDDKFETKKRFDALKDILGSKKLDVRVKHTENDRDDIYDYTITLCGENSSRAVTQMDIKDGGPVSGGQHDSSSVLYGGEDWLMVEYLNGDKYHSSHHCHGKARKTMLAIRCEEDYEKSKLILIEEARYDTSGANRHQNTPCYYLFEYNHPAACSSNKVRRFSSSNKLSGGAIFLIILVSIAAAYLLFGFVYKRFVVGAKGWEQIPNFSFWRKVGNASADGCDFVCRREERATTYKGMADALDIETTDDERDDGLLPM